MACSNLRRMKLRHLYKEHTVYVEIDRYIDDNAHVNLKRVEKATHIHTLNMELIDGKRKKK